MWIYILLATYYSMSSDSSLIAQSPYDGRDVCSSAPQSDDPLLVVSGQFCGHSYCDCLQLTLEQSFDALLFRQNLTMLECTWCVSLALIFYVVQGMSSKNRALPIPR